MKEQEDSLLSHKQPWKFDTVGRTLFTRVRRSANVGKLILSGFSGATHGRMYKSFTNSKVIERAGEQIRHGKYQCRMRN